jgi:hypothetical protein
VPNSAAAPKAQNESHPITQVIAQDFIIIPVQ